MNQETLWPYYIIATGYTNYYTSLTNSFQAKNHTHNLQLYPDL